MTQRCLFIIRDLPRQDVSVASAIAGEEPLSGTHSSGLLVAEGLARRGVEVGMHVVQGQHLTDTSFRMFSSIPEAAAWIGDGPTVWISYGDDAILDSLNASGLTPTFWTHLPLTPHNRKWLEDGRIKHIVTVSDSVRIPFLHTRSHARVGRIYNPLGPLFAERSADAPDRYSRETIAYSGAAGTTKGLHRVLEMWQHVRRTYPRAQLLVAGTGKLYGGARSLGRFNIASPEFEAKHVEPLVAEFGSLVAAGVEPVGLLSPRELRDLYARSSLGLVNLNWHEYTETFCCAAVEMLATGLPVFSVSRGALPETIGRTGGALLTRQPQLDAAAKELCSLLGDTRRLQSMAESGKAFVRTEYAWERTIDQWDRLLTSAPEVEELSGAWRGPKTARYFLETAAGRMHAGRIVDVLANCARVIRRS